MSLTRLLQAIIRQFEVGLLESECDLLSQKVARP
jgi:hypothetical protein